MSDAYGTEPRHAISFRVDLPTLTAMERRASEEGLSLASIARRALLRDLRQREVTELGAG